MTALELNVWHFGSVLISLDPGRVYAMLAVVVTSFPKKDSYAAETDGRANADKTRRRLHTHRTAGGDRDHRDPGGDVVARAEQSQDQGPNDQMRVEHETVGLRHRHVPERFRRPAPVHGRRLCVHAAVLVPEVRALRREADGSGQKL